MKTLVDLLKIWMYKELQLLFQSLHRARPELVEGYPRALEEILQQVQDERRYIQYIFLH